MCDIKNYKVIIPYSESSSPRKKFKIEYVVEAKNRAGALEKAEKEFSAYSDNNTASWVRSIDQQGLRIWKLIPGMPQTPKDIDEFAQKLSSDNQDELHTVLKTLGDLEDSSTSDAIINLFSHETPEIVALAVEALGKIGDPTNLGAIMTLKKFDTNERVKSCIVAAVGKLALPEDEVLSFLTKHLQDKDARVRANAVEAIENLKLAGTTRLLIPMLEDEDNRVKANVIKALWDQDDQAKLLESLKTMASNEDPWMKASCIFVLEKVNIPGRIELLAAMCCEEDPIVRNNAKEALFNSNEIDCLPYWLELISNDKDFSIISNKVLKLGAKAFNPLLAFNGTTKESKKYAAILLDILEQQILKTSGWIHWLKTKQKRLLKLSDKR